MPVNTNYSPKGGVTGVKFYEKQFQVGDNVKPQHVAKTQIKTADAKRSTRNGVLLLSNYKPKDFGNA